MPPEPAAHRPHEHESPWPPEPYLGLNYFRAQDRPLLVGRDDDIGGCSELLTHPQTRVLLLHGSTGAGKSSFLRAGLIPAIDEDGPSHLFLRGPDGDRDALFIRSTAAPIDQIARQIYLFAARPFPLRTPSGERLIDLTPALLDCADWEAYLKKVQEFDSPSALAESLRLISQAIPQTLVLIVDQAEEVLTLNPGANGYNNRSPFFAFLREFQHLAFDARILVALRTEYLGRFLDAIQVRYRDEASFCYFFLNELPPQCLIEAIERPTLKEELPPWGVPHDIYRFEMEPGLAERIVQDLLKARYSGPALPVLQIVCQGLYRGLASRATITLADYVATGGIEGQIVAHLKAALGWTETDLARQPEMQSALQAFLAEFYLMQDDGTVVARTRSADWALAQLTRYRSAPQAKMLLDRMTSSETLVLRRLRSVRPDGQIADEITLGHDTIALAVERWRSLEAEGRLAAIRDKDERRTATATTLYGIFAVVCIIAAVLSPSIRSGLLDIPVSAYNGCMHLMDRFLPDIGNYAVLSVMKKFLAGFGAFFWTIIVWVSFPVMLFTASAEIAFWSIDRIGIAWRRTIQATGRSDVPKAGVSGQPVEQRGKLP